MKDLPEMRTRSSSLCASSAVETLKCLGKAVKNGLCLSKLKKKVSWAEPLTIVRNFAVEAASRDVMPRATENANELRQIDLCENTDGKLMYFESDSLEQSTKRETAHISEIPRKASITREHDHMSLHSTGSSLDEMNKLFAMGQETHRSNLDDWEEEWV